jgi:glycosyltransferase A (GT-A) superfamily protein (DUF2064 family)
MKAAAAQVLAMGYRAAVIIGTDSPDLPVVYLEKAFHLLADTATDVVFGPCRDGGYYLLGMKEAHSELLRDVSWSTGKVLEQSVGKAESAGLTAALLPVWHDVDTVEDLARPELMDSGNGAPLTRSFIEGWSLKRSAAPK